MGGKKWKFRSQLRLGNAAQKVGIDSTARKHAMLKYTRGWDAAVGAPSIMLARDRFLKEFSFKTQNCYTARRRVEPLHVKQMTAEIDSLQTMGAVSGFEQQWTTHTLYIPIPCFVDLKLGENSSLCQAMVRDLA